MFGLWELDYMTIKPIMEKLSLGDEVKSNRCRKYYGSGYGSARIRIG
jgi:hypothetical protein